MFVISYRVCILMLVNLSLSHAVGAVPYDVTVEALNIAGCGDQVQQFCFTEEGGVADLLKDKQT